MDSVTTGSRIGGRCSTGQHEGRGAPASLAQARS